MFRHYFLGSVSAEGSAVHEIHVAHSLFYVLEVVRGYVFEFGIGVVVVLSFCSWCLQFTIIAVGCINELCRDKLQVFYADEIIRTLVL